MTLSRGLQSLVVMASLLVVGSSPSQYRLRTFPRSAPPEWGFASSFADLNGDRITDFIKFDVTMRGSRTYLAAIYLADDSGELKDATAVKAPPLANPYFPPLHNHGRLVDLDRDGDLDLVAANYGPGASAENTLWLNDGTGRFTDISDRLGKHRENSLHVTAFDANGDGRVDLFFSNSLAPHRLLLGDGRGFFKDVSGTHLPKMQPEQDRAAAAADFDGDGDLDLVLVKFVAFPIILFNDGQGHFASDPKRAWPVSKWACESVGVGDVDGDGDTDVILPNRLWFNPLPVKEEDRLMINDGKGNFTERKIPFAPDPKHWTQDALLGDLDGDGDLDYVSSQGHPDNMVSPVHTTRFYLNDGTGTFRDATGSKFLPDLGQSRAGQLLDVDDDGDLDFLSHKVTFTLPSRLWINMTRQIYAPAPPRRGQSYRLELWAEQGQRVALLFVGVKRTFLPLPPFGNWRVDPALLVGPGVLPFVTTGHRKLDLAIPNDNALKDHVILSQALIQSVKSPAKSRFTNVQGDRIR